MISILYHSFLSAIRGGFFKGGWGARIVLLLVAVYFLLIAIALAVFLPELVESYKPNELSSLEFSARFTLYFILGDVAFRFINQSLMSITQRYYILLPITYRKIANFILWQSQLNFLTLFALIIFIPFAKNLIFTESGIMPALSWMLGVVAILMGNTFFSMHFKRVFAGKTWAGFAMIGILGLVALEEWLTGGALQNVSQSAFTYILQGPQAMLLAVYPIAGYFISWRFLLKNRYEENWQVSSEDGGFWAKLDFQGKDLMSNLLANEWKLIIRHKRTRSATIMGLFFLLYGLFFYKDDLNTGAFFIAIFMVGFAAINYGQYLIAWEGRYFDGILVRSFSSEMFFRAKWRLLVFLNLVPFVLSLLYGFKDPALIGFHFTAFMFNVGFNSYLILFLSTYQRKPVDLNAGSALNYQGTSALQFIMILPLVVFPMLVFGLVAWPFGILAGQVTIISISLIGLVFHRYWIKEIAKNFVEKKYLMAEGFRQREN